MRLGQVVPVVEVLMGMLKALVSISRQLDRIADALEGIERESRSL
jgi:hypothetical protein